LLSTLAWCRWAHMVLRAAVHDACRVHRLQGGIPSMACRLPCKQIHRVFIFCTSFASHIFDSHIVRPTDSHANGHADSHAGRQARCMLLTPILQGHIDLHIGRRAECYASWPADRNASAHAWSRATGVANIHGIAICPSTRSHHGNCGSNRSKRRKPHSA